MAEAVRIGQASGGAGARGAGAATAPVHKANFQHVLMRSLHRYQAARAASLSHVNNALSTAMAAEGVPESWRTSLNFIIARESGGVVGVRNPVHSARGLFQLTKANYHLNPNGAASFGNAVEEAQGGIRYIRQRYGTADNAVAFWQTHHWY